MIPYRPSNFIPAQSVKSVKLLSGQPAFITRKKATGAKAVGVRYEKKALDKLETIKPVGGEWLRSPWFEFLDSSGKRWCQPDGVFIRDGAGIVFEVKYRHCAEAWFQLWRLYIPVLESLYGYRFEGVEVVKWLDPAVQFPERYTLTPDPFQVQVKGVTAVHVWNPQRD